MYRGNKDYKLDCNAKLWLNITYDCTYPPKYDKSTMRYINKRRRQRDRMRTQKYLKVIL